MENTKAILETFNKQLQVLNDQLTTLANDLVEFIDYTQMDFSTGHVQPSASTPSAVDTARFHLAAACTKVIRQHLAEALAEFDGKLQEAAAEFIAILQKYEVGADKGTKKELENIDKELDDLNDVYEEIKEGIKVIPMDL